MVSTWLNSSLSLLCISTIFQAWGNVPPFERWEIWQAPLKWVAWLSIPLCLYASLICLRPSVYLSLFSLLIVSLSPEFCIPFSSFFIFLLFFFFFSSLSSFHQPFWRSFLIPPPLFLSLSLIHSHRPLFRAFTHFAVQVCICDIQMFHSLLLRNIRNKLIRGRQSCAFLSLLCLSVSI